MRPIINQHHQEASVYPNILSNNNNNIFIGNQGPFQFTQNQPRSIYLRQMPSVINSLSEQNPALSFSPNQFLQGQSLQTTSLTQVPFSPRDVAAPSGQYFSLPVYSSAVLPQVAGGGLNARCTTYESDAIKANVILAASSGSNSPQSPQNKSSSNHDGRNYGQLMGDKYFRFMDNLIDMSETKTKKKEEEMNNIFKIPPPSTSKDTSNCPKQFSLRAKSGEKSDFLNRKGDGIKTGIETKNMLKNMLKRKSSTDSNALFDRGKARKPSAGTASLERPKDDTEWKNNQTAGCEVPAKKILPGKSNSDVNKTTPVDRVKQLSIPSKSSCKENKMSARPLALLDTFKDYTEWKNFMDYGIASTGNTSVAPSIAQKDHEKETKTIRKMLSEDVIEIEDETEELRKEKFWSGKDKIKSCLGLNLNVPRPRQLGDDWSKKMKQEEAQNVNYNQDFYLRTKTTLTSMPPINRNVRSSSNDRVQIQHTTKKSDTNSIKHTSVVDDGMAAGYDKTPKLADEAPSSMVTDNCNESEEVLRQMVIDMAQRPMAESEADYIVEMLMKEEVLNKPTEEVADFLLELINKSN